MIGDADLAYAAALLDAYGRLSSRTLPSGTDLPEVVVQGRIGALGWLADLCGVKVVEIEKDYNAHRCAEHCTAKHMHVASMTQRLVLSGARATIVLHAVQRFMRVQGRQARELVGAGQVLGYKTGVVNDMVRLGWPIPELREQPRARVALVRS